MKKNYPLALLLIAFAAFGCKNTEETETSLEDTAVTDTLDAGKSNELYGIVFRDIAEIPELKDYEHQAGAMIHEQDSLGNYKYAIAQFGNDKNYVIILEELVRESGNPKPKYRVLDTLNIPSLNIDEIIATFTCRRNKVADSGIIAIVKSHSSDDIEFYDNVIKAWQADTKTGQIIPITDLKGIDCANEGYGL